MMKPANNAPIYACCYQGFAEIARAHGYALAVHGSLARDFDVVCIPWVETPSSPAEMLRALTNQYAIRVLDEGPTIKAHGREVYTVVFKWGDVALDLSFMPRIARVDTEV